jgi:hypothetical protein
VHDPGDVVIIAWQRAGLGSTPHQIAMEECAWGEGTHSQDPGHPSAFTFRTDMVILSYACRPYEVWLPPPSAGETDFNSPSSKTYIGGPGFDMNAPEDLRDLFVESMKPFLPFLEPEGIAPDIAGIHPKIQSKDDPMKDWVIRHEKDR